MCAPNASSAYLNWALMLRLTSTHAMRNDTNVRHSEQRMRMQRQLDVARLALIYVALTIAEQSAS